MSNAKGSISPNTGNVPTIINELGGGPLLLQPAPIQNWVVLFGATLTRFLLRTTLDRQGDLPVLLFGWVVKREASGAGYGHLALHNLTAKNLANGGE
jgi:hypothetical protein